MAAIDIGVIAERIRSRCTRDGNRSRFCPCYGKATHKIAVFYDTCRSICTACDLCAGSHHTIFEVALCNFLICSSTNRSDGTRWNLNRKRLFRFKLIAFGIVEIRCRNTFRRTIRDCNFICTGNRKITIDICTGFLCITCSCNH